MGFDFSSIEIPSFEEELMTEIYSDFTDALYVFRRSKIENKGYLWNDKADPFYILRIDRYLKPLQPLGNCAFKYNDKAVIVVSNIGEMVDLSAFEGMPIEYMPILVFRHHKGPIKGISNGIQWTISTDYQRDNHFLNDTVVFKGVYKAVTAGEHKYKLKKVWDRFYYNL